MRAWSASPRDGGNAGPNTCCETASKWCAFLLLLLTGAPDEIGGSLGGDQPSDGKQWGLGGGSSDALLEPLLRALDRNPACLDEVASILDDLRATEAGRAKLPVGLEAVWAPIWQARQALRPSTHG